MTFCNLKIDVSVLSKKVKNKFQKSNAVNSPAQQETNNFKDWARANKKDISMDSLNEYQNKMMFNSRSYVVKTEQEKEEILTLAKVEKATNDITQIPFEEFAKKNQKMKWRPNTLFKTKKEAVEFVEKLKQTNQGVEVKYEKDEKGRYLVSKLIQENNISQLSVLDVIGKEILMPDGKVEYTKYNDEYMEIDKKIYFKKFFPIAFVKYSDNDTYFISENNPYIEQYLAHKKAQKPKIKPTEIYNLVHKYFDDANVFFEPMSQNMTLRVVENGNFSLQIPIFEKSAEDILSEPRKGVITDYYFVKFYQVQTKLKSALKAFAKEIQKHGYNDFSVKNQEKYTTTYEFIYTDNNKPFVPAQTTKTETQNTTNKTQSLIAQLKNLITQLK